MSNDFQCRGISYIDFKIDETLNKRGFFENISYLDTHNNELKNSTMIMVILL